ncbi:MAG TPA: AMP-binding protein, partial [Sphaerochaeta sp.]|nr:AMP-binding protein [Sphaerochaeta sp.]
MSKKRAKKKSPDEIVWTKRAIKKIKRADDLRPKLVYSYTMDSLVEATASRYGKRVALKLYNDEHSAVTYSQMQHAKDAIGLYLMDQGFGHGDRIALLGESSPTWLLAYFGITSIGCIAVPILPDFSSKEILEILSHSEAKAVVVNTRHFEKIVPFINDYPEALFRMEDLFHIPS